MEFLSIIWDLDDDPDGNVQHIAEHDLTKEEVLCEPEKRGTSRSSGLPLVFGTISTGRTIAVIFSGNRRGHGQARDGIRCGVAICNQAAKTQSPRGGTSMPSKELRRVTSTRKLTPDEAVAAKRLRDLVEKDKDDIRAEGRRLLAEKRRRQAAALGNSTLGQKIRAAREAHGLTQADLALRAQVAQAYLSYLEQDEREPSLSIAARLARELEIPLDELAGALMT